MTTKMVQPRRALLQHPLNARMAHTLRASPLVEPELHWFLGLLQRRRLLRSMSSPTALLCREFLRMKATSLMLFSGY
jgi:hypothetical protein